MTTFSFKQLLLAAGMALLSATAMAQSVPAGAPAGTTVECKDGSFAAPQSKSGSCSGHKGVKHWYGTAAAKAGSAQPQPTAANGTKETPPAVAASPRAQATPDRASLPAAAGGGAGKVWVNEASKVYHCEGDRYYGRTKKGEYMSEQEAKAHGARASHKKTCGA
ncbi:DUF3761 domain-containing protein [Caenimonas terrae]|uniref:DUF3761 domain-containing protein n=1 Tax=Caenimonas terrae TaxID=696074 RepID=A0ABW0NHB0_9BURK